MDTTLTVRRSYTPAGERVIPLTAGAMDAIFELRERAKGFFGDNRSQEWFVSTGGEGQRRALTSPEREDRFLQ